ncbi:tetratricopeptide repeat protein [Tamlana sp. 2201CG12-4]|uniref:tetratricopeptide repeat protein n=1 Tax=Tamlana sp. 2201CG12-4 TaxID=3112582 RepID=UPI002DB71DE5|nr:tetratricopeptide repeat protein [Tamlana sp. 2201CG12-4]MEC3906268.1 tetratricopeptide repeat protein [Tamlana sp. 2201CG12-4]
MPSKINIVTNILIILFITKVGAQSSPLQIGDSLFAQGNFTKAIEKYSEIEHQIIVYHKIANAYKSLGNYDKSLKYYQKSIDSHTENALIKYEFGKLLILTKNYNQASNIFNNLISIDNENPNYHYNLGLILEHQKDSTAQISFKKAFRLDSTHQKAIYKIAKFHMIKRKHKTANRFVDIGLKSFANNKSLINIKAQNFFLQKKHKDASKWFEKLIELGESTQFIHEKLSFCYKRLSDYQKAIIHQKKALEFDTKNAENLYLLGLLYSGLHDFEKAEKYIKESLMIQDTPLDEQYIKLGVIYNHQKKKKEAIGALKRAVSENHLNQEANYILLLTKDSYYKDIDARIKLFEKFKKKFPNSKFRNQVDYKISELKEKKFFNEKED